MHDEFYEEFHYVVEDQEIIIIQPEIAPVHKRLPDQNLWQGADWYWYYQGWDDGSLGRKRSTNPFYLLGYAKAQEKLRNSNNTLEEITMLTETDLRHFTGSENLFQHWLKMISYTEGVQYLAKKGQAYWLIDAIASYQNRQILNQYPELVDFQLWQLTVNPNKSAILTCQTDSNCPILISQNIEFTDFPITHVKLYLRDQILMLPSEY